MLLLGLGVSSTAQAQGSLTLHLGGSAVPVYTWADPVPKGGSLSEARVVQPVVMVHAGAINNRLRLVGTLNLEGWTIANGELAMGDWGEGFDDRRHPHTYVHEAMLMYEQPVVTGSRPVSVSVSAGKGFAAFGTDDPMSRPPLRFPVNHHLSQILERAVAILGVRAGPLMLEGSLFNGDEPERPSQWPKIDRFGDSWSTRLSLLASTALEFQGSYAEVHSPEHRPGFGTDQEKWNVSGRWDGMVGRSPGYALVEWARTSEADGFFIFHSILAEGAWSPSQNSLYYRFERTDRPEEERGVSRFRSPRPILENSILGITRWTIHTAGYGRNFQAGTFTVLPFGEVSYGRIADVGEGLFNTELFYGKTSFWSFTLGIRLGLGMALHRMGRYGVAQNTAPPMAMTHHGHNG